MMVTFYSVSVYAQVDGEEVSHRKGRDIFKEKGCAQCHSVFGSDGNGGPDLGKRKFYGTHLELAARMWNHFPKMYKKMQKTDIEYQNMSTQEMEQLIAYLSFMRYTGKPGNEYKGQELLKKSCMVCHKFRGKGGDIGPEFDETSEYLSSIKLVESMWNHGPDMMDVSEEQQIKRPVFKGNDIENLLAAMRSYMSTTNVPVGTFGMGDPAQGKELFNEKGCAECHSFRGVGGDLGPDFADVDLDYPAVQIAGKMWNHGPKMWEIMQEEDITFPVFEDGEMADVVAYLYALKLEDGPGDPERGRRIISDKGCVACHSVGGEGSTISKDLTTLEGFDSPPAMIAAMWNHAPGMREKQLEKKLKWPKLKARDMADVYAYLYQTTHTPDEIE
jgi:mono/diheme cytochrome c family protein